ncbi:ATP-binding cassette domain-containing protein [Oceaniglobus indicus]|uniref:ATP-binding cassette domain-containing protein n=1 Tax=Oceaniglobus indicus TaxID=2047749 RepID=UPI000C192D98|nr:sugar ABC transporter ATP-binding protein [Oceaniglobus indicus]
MATEPLVVLSNARMHFGSVRALDGVDLSISSGECVGLIGHNGAGKSTAVNLINGGLTATDGDVTYTLPDGSTATGAAAARAAGVRSVFQELSLCPNLTVEENMRVPQRDLTGAGWRKRARVRIAAALDAVFPGHGIDAGAEVGDLSLAERQMVEIAIGFSDGPVPARLVILDEPTSSLDAGIAGQLTDYVRGFCAGGGAVIFISHMLGEVFDVATRIDVLKDGKITDSRAVGDFTQQGLIDAMGHVASEAAKQAADPNRIGDEVLTTDEGLSARRGELVGLSGLAGHGQAAALARFYLARSAGRGQVRNPDVCFVAGDRVRDGVMPLWSILRNVSLTALASMTRFGLVDREAERALGADWKKRMGIRTDDMGNPILSLSGGNQQKALFARALASSADIVVMDDPMRGVDVGTKQDAYAMIRAEAEHGRTFLWYSTETEEVCQCDRVFVFRNGAISAELTGDDINEQNILAASFEMQGQTS